MELRTNEAGEAIFKIVAVSHAGAVAWVKNVHAVTKPEMRGELTPISNEGWDAIAFDLVLGGIRAQEHPVRLHLFAHEGAGFIGQPGSAKDVVYEGASVVVGFGQPDDWRDLIAVLGADVERLASQGEQPTVMLIGPEGTPLVPKPAALSGAIDLRIDWKALPLDPLKAIAKTVLKPYR